MLWTVGQPQPSQFPDYSTLPEVIKNGSDDANDEKAIEESEEFFC